MGLYILSLILTQIALLILLIFMQEASSNTNKYEERILVLRTIFVITLVSSQAVFVYLLLRFSKPVKFDFSIRKATDSSEIDSKFASLLVGSRHLKGELSSRILEENSSEVRQ